MKKALLAVGVLLLASPLAWGFDFPRVDAVVLNQNQAAGTFTASSAVLSGTVTPYAAGGVGLNYLTAQVDGKLQGGFFVVPPQMAGQLRDVMNPTRNYTVNLVYMVDRVNVNGFTPAQGVVTQINFLDGSGRVVASIAAGR